MKIRHEKVRDMRHAGLAQQRLGALEPIEMRRCYVVERDKCLQ